MAWLVVQKNDCEWIIRNKSTRRSYYWQDPQYQFSPISLSEGSIEKLTGKKLTWEDELVEI